MSIHETLEEILNTNLEVDNIEIIRINLTNNNNLDNKNDKYSKINEEVKDLSKRLDNLISNINFENAIQTPPF